MNDLLISFCIDLSPSMSGKMQNVKKIIICLYKMLIEKYNNEHDVYKKKIIFDIVTFGKTIEYEEICNLDSFFEFLNGLENDVEGKTDVFGAMELAYNKIDTKMLSSMTSILFLITDGDPDETLDYEEIDNIVDIMRKHCFLNKDYIKNKFVIPIIIGLPDKGKSNGELLDRFTSEFSSKTYMLFPQKNEVNIDLSDAFLVIDKCNEKCIGCNLEEIERNLKSIRDSMKITSKSVDML